MFRVKIHGAGSIGNHLAHASRTLGWGVTVCDISGEALNRMKNDIYPQRYGKWDEGIRLYNINEVPIGEFDLIIIGTPPDSHIPLTMKAMEENPKAILIEKPLCPPSLELAQVLYAMTRDSGTKVFVGYDHVVGKTSRQVEELYRQGAIGEIVTLDAEFREHWGWILAAHPWLNRPEDSYLGSWERGGGASGEHSHGINLWQHFAHVVGAGRVIEVEAMLQYVTAGRAAYDQLCILNLKTEKGLIGRVVQDVVTTPPRKRLKLQGTKGSIEWVSGYSPEGDAVIYLQPGAPAQVNVIPKKRLDDFIEELKHIQGQQKGDITSAELGIERGLDTMLVLAAAHLSEAEKCRVEIDYRRNYTPEAIRHCR